jgi:hypothetical protein
MLPSFGFTVALIAYTVCNIPARHLTKLYDEVIIKSSLNMLIHPTIHAECK